MALATPPKSGAAWDADEEIAALIATLHQTGERLEELTYGEVDTVADTHGRAFLLRRAQDQLRQREATRQASILNALPSHVALLDIRGRIISVNKSWRQFAGVGALGAAHGIGLDYLEICDSALGDGAAEAHQAAEGIRSVLSGAAKTFSIEYPCHSPTEQFWFLLTATPLAEDRQDGAVVRRLDVTAEKQAKDELRRSNSLKSAILQSSLDSIITIDHEGRIVEFNAAAEATFELPCEQALGKVMAELIVPPRLRDAHRRGFSRYLATGAGQILGKRLELSAIRADGTEFPVELTITAIGDAAKPMFTAFLRDITERKETEESLRRFAAAMDSTTDAIYLVDRDSMSFVHVNAAACRILSKTREEVLAMGPARVLSSSPAELARIYDQLIAGDVAAEPLEMLWHRKDGSGVWVELRRHALRSGDRSMIVTLVRDITDRKDGEIKIQRLNRVYAVLSGINTLIVRVRDRDELFREACRIAVEEGQFHMAWIGVVDRIAMQIAPAASAGSDEGFFETVRKRMSLLDDAPDGHGPPVLAVRGKLAVIVNDTLTDPRIRHTAAHADRGIHALVCLPLMIAGDPVAVLCLHGAEAGYFDEAEMKLLEELAGDISFALANIEKEEKVRKLTRVSAMLSGINALIVRARDRDELFGESCRIAAEHGKFGIAWIGRFDPAALEVTPIAWSGLEAKEHVGTIASSTRGNLPEGNGVVGRAIRELRPAFNNDISIETGVGSGRRKKAFQSGYRSLIALPLTVEGVAVGSLSLYAGEINFFDEEEIKLLAEIASNISLALEHIEKAEKLERVTRGNAMLSGINGAIVRIRSRQQLFEEACRIAVETGGLLFAWLGVVDEAEALLRPVASAGVDDGFLNIVIKDRYSLRDDAPQGRGIGARSVREGRALVVNDIEVAADLRYRQAHADRGIKAIAALPLFIAGRAVGVLGLHAAQAGFFDEDEMKLLTEVAGNIAFALEHIEKEEKVQRLTRVYAVLSGINTLIVRIRSRQQLFEEACRIAVEHGGFKMAWIGMVDRSAMKIVPIAAMGAEPEFLTLIKDRFSLAEDSPTGKTMSARAVREKKAFVSNKMRHDSFLLFAKERIARGISSMAVLPLLVSDEAVGVFALFAGESGFFDEQEMKLLTELAGDIAFALEHIEKAEKIARMTRVNAMLSSINGAIVRIRDRQALFAEACRIAVDIGSLPFAWLGVVDDAEMRLRPVASAGTADEGFLETLRNRLSDDAPEGHGISARSVRQNLPLMVGDIQADPGMRNKQAYADRGIKSIAALPMCVGGRVIGAFTLHATEAGFFDKDEMKLLGEVASNIAFALEHIEKEEKVRRLTRVYAVLSGINTLIVRTRDREELFRETCRIAVQSGGFPLAWVARADRRDQRVQAVAWAGDERGFVQLTRPTVEAKGQGKAGLGAQAMERRMPAVCNDIEADGSAMRYPKEALERGYRSAAALPLVVDGTAVAALVLYAAEAGSFDEEELRLLTELAGDISFALENIGRQDKLDKLARLRAISGDINAAIIRIQDGEALLRETCRIAVERGNFELVWIAFVDQAKQHVQPVAWAGLSPESAGALTWAGFTRPGVNTAEVIQTRQLAVRDEIDTDLPAGPLRREAIKRGFGSSVCLPFMIDDSVVATMVIFAPGRGFFDAEEAALLSEVAANVSLALQSFKKQEKLDYLAYYDALTGLANRSLFLERVAQYIRSAASGGHKLAVFLLDLERFKNINDTLGRPTGDALLKQVAEWLTRNAGGASLVARFSADHFAVVVPEVKQEGNLARLIEREVEEFLEHPFRLNDAVFRIALKVGVVIFPDDGANVDELLKNAEAALKKAKASGDRYLFYTQKMTDAVAGKLTLENQLRQALDKGEFVLHYQPKVSLASGKLTSAEALIRWNDPRTGLVPPGRFIPVLEETGLIYEVGRWALRKSLEDYLRWRAAGLPAVRIAVNVSPMQLRNRDFVTEIGEVISIDPHAAAGLELEITESLIMEDVKHNIASLQAIRAMGVSIAIDDFGTGFSSLSYLAKLPVDTLKIDRSFVIDMTASPEGLALVSTIINLAHSLKLKVVAEGVETEEQSRLLRLLNCDEIQGYLFSKPVPGEIFETSFLAPPGAG